MIIQVKHAEKQSSPIFTRMNSAQIQSIFSANIKNKLYYFYQYILMHRYLVFIAKFLEGSAGIIALFVIIVDYFNQTRLIDSLVVEVLSFSCLGLVILENVFDLFRKMAENKEFKIKFDKVNDICQILRFILQLVIVSMFQVSSKKELVLATISLMTTALIIKLVQKIYKYVMLNKLQVDPKNSNILELQQYYKHNS